MGTVILPSGKLSQDTLRPPPGPGMHWFDVEAWP